MFLEFDQGITKEARFAYQCDKLECDMQSKIYDEEVCVDLTDQHNNNAIEVESIRKLLESGESFSSMWLLNGQERYNYDENFKSVSDYVIEHKIKN